MIILAVYYTLADIVLLGQCFYYRGFTLKDEPSQPPSAAQDDAESSAPASERTALLSSKPNGDSYQSNGVQDQSSHSSSTVQPPVLSDYRRHSATSSTFRDILHPSVDGTHLSPATPFIEPSPKQTATARHVSAIQSILFNFSAILLVCAAGILGWYVSPGSTKNKGEEQPPDDTPLSFDTLGQVFGYFCAVLYLGSRLPQILLNYRRKSTEGVSLLFFLFACIGNLTYVLSILAYSPVCHGGSPEQTNRCRPGEASALYGRYILVNLSWLIGSLGTLFLDMCIFVQFFLYQDSGYIENQPASQGDVAG
ncbi:PQ-loop repeat-containing protein [Aspergillus melleus]|uniref:PQ-loop repeat-containing protein n=1 Tax=Aspergillus melleus TaxID=138277 RepID=UPI001E8EBE7C|nr:putative vacuolar membrane transporter for cationic amino acids [Aspergillus melleus]KAH8430404.1 putative vacuolar membrane transporter for cationic amino acids [Aspergillus melleus]